MIGQQPNFIRQELEPNNTKRHVNFLHNIPQTADMTTTYSIIIASSGVNHSLSSVEIVSFYYRRLCQPVVSKAKGTTI